jgi:hypothetical protein
MIVGEEKGSVPFVLLIAHLILRAGDEWPDVEDERERCNPIAMRCVAWG